MTKRRMKPARSAAIARMETALRMRNVICPNCGAKGGGHFVPAGLGDPGFYICTRLPR